MYIATPVFSSHVEDSHLHQAQMISHRDLLCIYVLTTTYGGFHEWGYPFSSWFIAENPTKMDDLGVPLFYETSIYDSLIFFPYNWWFGQNRYEGMINGALNKKRLRLYTKQSFKIVSPNVFHGAFNQVKTVYQTKAECFLTCAVHAVQIDVRAKGGASQLSLLV